MLLGLGTALFFCDGQAGASWRYISTELLVMYSTYHVSYPHLLGDLMAARKEISNPMMLIAECIPNTEH